MGKHNLMVMLLGEFENILGIEFLKKFQFVPFPHLDGMMVMNESNAGFLKGVHPFGKFSRVEMKRYNRMLMSAMSIDKGMKRSDETILSAMVELKIYVMVELPDCVA